MPAASAPVEDFNKYSIQMKYFTIQELCQSDTAAAKEIDNTPPICATASLTDLISDILDPVREKWGKPIRVTSGYRCPALNKAVGGTPSSQHLRGEAADITTGNKKGNQALYELIKSSELDFDQLIDEKNFTWLHVSYTKTRKNRRNAFKIA